MRFGSTPNKKTHFSSFDKSVFLWDVENTTIIKRFRGHAGRVNCVKLHEEGSLAVSGSVDGTARIWDLRSRSYEPIQERINFVMRIKWGAPVFDRHLFPAPCGIRAKWPSRRCIQI